MLNSLNWSSSEQAYFEKTCHFQFQFSKEHVAMEASSLFEDKKLEAFLTTIGPKIGSENKRVIASLFFKRYAFCCLTSSLYAMTFLNKQFDMRVQNVMLIDEGEHQSWLPSFSLKNLEGLSMVGDRRKWRESALTTLFSENITPTLQQLASVTKASKAMLWENAFIYIVWLYQTWLHEDHSPELKATIAEDYAYIVKEAQGTLFNTSKNPFSSFIDACEKNHFTKRTTCCLYNQTEAGTCCKTCPNSSF
ncbi:hypothetical protein A374_05031 [Fictibacillus macauensis ZFHKF-1]|uniref:Aerobactin siderophore biosynthesis IucA/IucC-like C-terminal domain-containing protein n=1 Tax=Fictibacillus macauensis ZFHKF-1 TaxID=1196324 RepID=I8UHB3_9BACL|nr:IucA/IucC family C-terminal-domain containing protein [Fictibacillus macauensis]EIT86300.1 hypothetical protein A374_05031 [Fictibacillus macauensis ZFHKF-1]